MDKKITTDLDPSDPFHTPIAVQEALMRRDIREAAKVYKMHGLKMVGGDANGVPYEFDPDDILNRPEPQKAAG